jgi:hypothetical protein
MARYARLPLAAGEHDEVWVNPDHVVSVVPAARKKAIVTLTSRGGDENENEYYKIALSADAVVAALELCNHAPAGSVVGGE